MFATASFDMNLLLCLVLIYFTKLISSNYIKQARKLQATLVRNYELLTHLLTHWRGWSVELLA